MQAIWVVAEIALECWRREQERGLHLYKMKGGGCKFYV